MLVRLPLGEQFPFTYIFISPFGIVLLLLYFSEAASLPHPMKNKKRKGQENKQKILHNNVYATQGTIWTTRLISIVSKPIKVVIVVIVIVVFVKVKLGLKNFWFKSNSCPKKCWIKKKYASKKGFKSQNVLIKKLRLKRIKVQKNFGSKKIWGQKNFESNKFWVKWF